MKKPWNRLFLGTVSKTCPISGLIGVGFAKHNWRFSHKNMLST